MATFTASTHAAAPPSAVLATLTDPASCARWSPVAFRVQRLDGERLVAGSQARVIGEFAGRPIGFDVDVQAADDARLELRAAGPILLDVRYDITPAPGGSALTARIDVRQRPGLIGRLLAGAGVRLLAGGVLDRAVRRVAVEAAA